jgi:uncharacterized protein (TIGR03435 family)
MSKSRRLGSTRTVSFLVVIVLTAATSGTWIRAQSSPAQSFDVISIKPNHTPAGSSLGDGTNGMPGHFHAMNYSLRGLIQYAYDVKAAQIEGLPTWADSQEYDVDAKVDDAMAEHEKSLPREQEHTLAIARLKSLLAARFALQMHHETKTVPVLELTLAKGGPKLVEMPAVPTLGEQHPLPPGSWGMQTIGTLQWRIEFNQAPLKGLIDMLASQPEVGGRVLIDRTDLNGKYTFTLQWARQNLSADGASSDTSGPSLFSALQEQLGLRLESAKAPVDVLVVDQVAEPSPN